MATSEPAQPQATIRKHYPICIKWGDEETAFGIQIPDIPGAITAGDTFEEAHSAAIEIAHLMLQEIAASGQKVPHPKSMNDHLSNPDYSGMGWGMLEIDITPYLGKTEKVNITLPGFVIRQIDRDGLYTQAEQDDKNEESSPPDATYDSTADATNTPPPTSSSKTASSEAKTSS